MSKSSDKSRTRAQTPSQAAESPAAQPYVVLARKYRPQTFDDLIGQDIMVRTLRNAFAMDRIAQAYMLTGVRGVGKTTTARILARALNYERQGAPGKPTLDIAEPGVHCRAIMESRHVDVLEMDAASNTGIDDIREIIEAVRYKPASARYRLFIIDEVHMLSKSAFNGLLKTLEEPPPHVKFIFATTEIRKVPVTILSRCQRFDLRRVDAGTLVSHLTGILTKEGQTVEEAALALIARAAEGSVRDSLSLMDQALTLSQGHLISATVLEMLGLSGRSAIFDLLECIFRGEAKAAIASLNALHDKGADPLMILTDAADAVHALSRLKAVPGIYPADFSLEERTRADKLSTGLPVSRLASAWQMLLKGLDEAAGAPRPFAAAEMLIIRMCYMAQLPSPAEIIGELKAKPAGPGEIKKEPPLGVETSPAQVLSPMKTTGIARGDANEGKTEIEAEQPSRPNFGSFEDIVAHAAQLRDIKLKSALEEQVELVNFGPGFLELHVLEGAPRNFAQDLSRKLQAWTGERWVVSLSEERGLAPLGARRRMEEARAVEEIRKHPAVKNVMRHFPDAEIKTVRSLN
jgi:DNA polymerase III subunit gamma/tau